MTPHFRILGVLSVGDAEITAGRDRVVLAMLLLRPNRTVAVEELIDAVWDEDPPSTARGQLQACVSRLRRVLPPDAISTGPDGYAIVVAESDLDALVFERMIAEPTAGSLRRGLDLWRGPALAGIDSASVRRAAGPLDELRLIAYEDWFDLELAAGRHRDLTAELADLVGRFPLRERLRAQLIRALAGAGRRPDALAEFRRAEALLRDELGIEPGPELRAALRQATAGTLPPAIVEPPVRRTPVRALPRTISDFTGRADLVARLRKVIADSDPALPVALVIDGMPGSGKTSLALHLATQVADAYPDAHLFTDLHGHSPTDPAGPSAAAFALLRQLGVDARLIPDALDERISLWRTEVASRRALIVLDNVQSSAQVAELLPGTAGSLTLITSRRRLVGLDAVHPESLSVLTGDEAIQLLGRIAGDRVAAEPEAALEVVRRCSGLPLAIRLAGARLAHRPRWRVSDLVHRLGSATLPELAAEDRTVASAFALSYAALTGRAQDLFRRLGLHPGRFFDVLTAAALSGLSRDAAEDVLDDLADAHLIEEPAPGRFRLHDLLREYAAMLAVELPVAIRRATVVGLADLTTQVGAATVTGDHRRFLARDLGPMAPLRPDLVAAVEHPARRLDWERPDLAALQDALSDVDALDYVWRMARAVWLHLWRGGYTHDIIALQQRALAAAETLGDRTAEAGAANYLSSGMYRTSRYAEAIRLLDRAVTIRLQDGDVPGAVRTMDNLAALHVSVGRQADGLRVLRRAGELARRGGIFVIGPGRLNTEALVATELGRYPEALTLQRRCLLASIEAGEMAEMGNSLRQIASIKRRAGLASTTVCRRGVLAALRIFQRIGYRVGEAEAYNELGVLARVDSDHASALEWHRSALDLIDRIGVPKFQAEFLVEHGVTLTSAGATEEARQAFRAALARAGQYGLRYSEALALRGLAEVEPERGHEERAHRILRELGFPVEHRSGTDLQHRSGNGGRMEE